MESQDIQQVWQTNFSGVPGYISNVKVTCQVVFGVGCKLNDRLFILYNAYFLSFRLRVDPYHNPYRIDDHMPLPTKILYKCLSLSFNA